MTSSYIRTSSIKKFQSTVWSHYHANGRRVLLWRKTKNAYHILVSEVMLQQTQVDRVLPKYRSFLRQFPTIRALANAPLSAVLATWSGLGYNRRAVFLKRAAEAVLREHGGRVPKDVASLEALPGVGPYTARAVACFAFNEPTVFIETNIRTAFLHHFFNYGHPMSLNRKYGVHDREILALVEKTLDRQNSREWYYALMDYGAHIKKTIGNLNRASKHYAKQSRFKGSDREARGKIVRVLLERPRYLRTLAQLTGKTPRECRRILSSLTRDGIVVFVNGQYQTDFF